MKDRNKKKKITCVVLIIIAIILILTGLFLKYKTAINANFKNDEKKNIPTKKNDENMEKTPTTYLANDIENFDLSFLKLENNKSNVLYSPISIKYALSMLRDATSGNSKNQIDRVLGKYNVNKYENNNNISFTNAIFINNSFKKSINSKYIKQIKDKYNAETVYDSFNTPDNLNKWVSNNTLKKVNNVFTRSISSLPFIMFNNLTINMQWDKAIQSNATTLYKNPDDFYWGAGFLHEKYDDGITFLETTYPSLVFNNNINAKSVQFVASVNNYNIVKTLGEENIRNTILNEYQDFINNDKCGVKASGGNYLDANSYAQNFIDEISKNYKKVSISTDFQYYIDDDVKMFAKDLKKHNNIQLQYIAIMPEKEQLSNYIDRLTKNDIASLISKLKEVKSEDYPEGKIFKIKGSVPLFKFDYQLDLVKDLPKVGITDVFDSHNSKLNNLTNDKNIALNSIEQKNNIEFSNEGISESSQLSQLGIGDGIGCEFKYSYEVPLEEIDVTFDKPYLFLIRNKDTGEVWFIGTVYEPTIND